MLIDELKYLPQGARSAQVEKAFQQAADQVERYASDERLVPLLTRGQALRAGMLVFVGAKRVIFRPWPAAAPQSTRAETSPTKGKEAGSGKKRAIGARRGRRSRP